MIGCRPTRKWPARIRIARRVFGSPARGAGTSAIRKRPPLRSRAGIPLDRQESQVIPRISLSRYYAISRIIKGGWHLAGDHGDIDPEQAQKDMATFVDAGITTFDCADIYTGVELLIGGFRR